MSKAKIGKKGPFDKLDKEFKDAVDSMGKDEVKARVATVALAQSEMDEAEKDDQHLKEVKDAAAEAGKSYSEPKKINKLRIRYLRKRLGELGAK